MVWMSTHCIHQLQGTRWSFVSAAAWPRDELWRQRYPPTTCLPWVTVSAKNTVNTRTDDTTMTYIANRVSPSPENNSLKWYDIYAVLCCCRHTCGAIDTLQTIRRNVRAATTFDVILRTVTEWCRDVTTCFREVTRQADGCRFSWVLCTRPAKNNREYVGLCGEIWTIISIFYRYKMMQDVNNFPNFPKIL